MHPLDVLFWTCLMLGAAYTVVTLLMGGLSHVAGHVGDLSHTGHIGADAGMAHGHAGHVDVGHGGHADVGHGGHADAGHGGHAHGEAHGDHVDADGGGGRFNILAYLNPMSVAGFLLGFGGIGAMARTFGAQPLASTLYGLAAGFGLWLVAYLVATRLFAASEGSSHNTQEQLIGMKARVTAPIADGRPGMVCYTVTGCRQSIRAITDDVEPLPVGSMVRIRRIEGNTAHVVSLGQSGDYL